MIVDAIMKVLDIILEQVARGAISLDEARKLARESIAKLLEAEATTDEKRAALAAEIDEFLSGHRGPAHPDAVTTRDDGPKAGSTGLLADDGTEVTKP